MARGGVLFVRVSQPRDGETSAECARREMYEETAHAIDVPAARWLTTYTDRNGVRSGVVVPGETRKHECMVAVALLSRGEYAGAAPAPLLAEHESLIGSTCTRRGSTRVHEATQAARRGAERDLVLCLERDAPSEA